jgi:hypothetical protein
LHNGNRLQRKATSAPEKWDKNEAVWQKNRGSGGIIFHIFLRFFNFARMLPLHVTANQAFAHIGVITKKDAKKPTVGFCVFEGCGKFIAMRMKMTLDRNRKQREPQIDSDQHRIFMDHSLELFLALIPASLEGRAEDVMRHRIAPLFFIGIGFICVHLVNLWLSSALIRPGSPLLGAAGSCWELWPKKSSRTNETHDSNELNSSWTNPRQPKVIQSSPKQSKLNKKN